MSNQSFVDEPDIFEDEDMPFADEPQSSEIATVEDKPAVAFLPPDEVPDLDDYNEGMNIAPVYWEVESKGESKRGILVAWSKLNGQNGPVDMAVLQNRQGVWTSAAVNLVQQLKNLKLGTSISATYDGKEKTGGGFMVKKFTVRLLNPKPALPDMNLKPGGVTAGMNR